MQYNLTKKDSGLIYIYALLLPQIIGGIVLGIYCSFFASQDLAMQTAMYTYLSALLPQLCFCGIFFIFTRKRKMNYNFVGAKQKLSLKNVLLVILIAIVLFSTLFYLVDLINKIFQSFGINLEAFETEIDNSSPLKLIVNILTMALLPAIFEELIFRGLIFSGLRSLGKWLAIVLSALMFSLMHLSLVQFIYPIIMGIIFAYLFDKTNCIYYTIILHFCNNSLALVVDYFNIGIFSYTYGLTFVNALYIILGAIFGIAVTIFIIKKFIRANGEKTESDYSYEKDENSNLLFVSFVIAIFLWLLALITNLKG